MVSIIIPNYNGEAYLEVCLQSIFKQTYQNFEIIIVDNHSTDGSIELISNYQKNKNNIYVVQNDENLGFSSAVNQGIKKSNKELIFLLNNDVELEVDCLDNLIKSIKKDPRIFSVQAKMLQYYNRELIDDAGDFYTIVGWAYKRGDGKPSYKYNKEEEIFSTCAGAALYRKEVFGQIGIFDENFFAYMEDVDISYRARIYGYKNVFCPWALAYHIGSATSGGKYSKFKIQISARNNVYVPFKNMPFVQFILNFPFLIMGFIIKYFFFCKKGYGSEYMNGFLNGIKTLNKVKRVKYKENNLINYLKIEYHLVVNTIQYIFSKISEH